MHSALLMMDYQSGIIARHNAETAVAAASVAIDAARSTGLLVLWIQVGFRPNYPDVSRRNRMFSAVAENGNLTLGEADAEFHPLVRPQPDDVVVTKKRVSAFAGSDLEVVLRSRGIDTLVLGGVATSGVVLSTVRQAADLDYQMVVLADACADIDGEVHQVLVSKVFPRQCEVTMVGEWTTSITR